MMEAIRIQQLGRSSYEEVLKQQEALFETLLSEKREGEKSQSPMTLILCVHEPVFTLGKSGDENNLLPIARQSDATFFRTSRGGDITYHGPGQLVGYPILDLERLNIGLARYIELIEETVIQTIGHYGIKGERLDGEAGVWLDVENPVKTRKICAIGVRASRWVTMHGFAFNIATDLRYFDMINPCGFTDKGVTTLEKEVGHTLDFQEVTDRFLMEFSKVFDVELSSSETKVEVG